MTEDNIMWYNLKWQRQKEINYDVQLTMTYQHYVVQVNLKENHLIVHLTLTNQKYVEQRLQLTVTEDN